jgi:hypothetical protein
MRHDLMIRGHLGRVGEVGRILIWRVKGIGRGAHVGLVVVVLDVLVLLVHWGLIVRMVVAEKKTKRSKGEEKRAVAVFSRWDNAGRRRRRRARS